MAVTPDSMVGKVYRFKPRSQWPVDAQSTLPDDRMYYIHPAIVLTSSPKGVVTVVTTTTHPHLHPTLNSHIPISFASPLIPVPPLIMKHPFPRTTASYASLGSRRTFAADLFVPFGDEKGQFELVKKSRRRLANLVREYEVAVHQSTATASQRAAARVAAVERLDKSNVLYTGAGIGTRSTVAKSKPSKATSKAETKTIKPVKQKTAPKVLLSAQVSTQPPKDDHLDIQDIKASVSGLKIAVAALENLCAKLEEGSISAAASVPQAIGEKDMVADCAVVTMSRALVLAKGRIVPMEHEIDGLAGKDKSKRSRFGAWLSKLWRPAKAALAQ